jgi:hypothetical protein
MLDEYINAIFGLVAGESYRRITTPMHTDRRELIGCEAEVICGG